MCIKLVMSISTMFLIINMSSAQNFTADVSTASAPEYFNDATPSALEVENVNKVREDVYFEVPSETSHFNWETRSFSIVEAGTKYSKAELLDRITNKTIVKVKLDEFNKDLDMSNVPAGSYYLILTNDAGEVHSEKVVIL